MPMTKITENQLGLALWGVMSPGATAISRDTLLDAVYGPSVARPFESSIDLIELYAANLRNGGAPAGPRSDRLGKMTRLAFQKAGFLDNGSLYRFSRVEFAVAAANIVKEVPLVDRGGRDYRSDLLQISQSEDSSLSRLLMFKLVSSIEQFAKYFIDKHQGSAIEFGKQFSARVAGDSAEEKTLDAAEFRGRMMEHLRFPLMGPAITPNFMKDSQIGRARALDDLGETYLGTLAKPDMHVMRLMLCITERVSLGSEEELIELCFTRKFKELYSAIGPGPNWPTWSASISPEDRCLNDLNFLAFTHLYPGIFLDRILYMAGSGNSHEPALVGLREVDQVERYRRFLSGLELLNFTK